MSWVVMERAIAIAERTGRGGEMDAWREVRDAIHADVLEHGWSEKLRSFVQQHGSKALDAENIVRRAESLTQPAGIFFEEADACNNELLGNYLLLFSQVEHIRAVLAINRVSGPKSSIVGPGHEAAAKERATTGIR